MRLAEYIRDMGFIPEQAQDFLSDAVHRFHLYVLYRHQSADRRKAAHPTGTREKAMQRALIQYRLPENYEL